MYFHKMKKVCQCSIALAIFLGLNTVHAQWQYNGSNIYYNNGNVGIGTSNPSYRFHINVSGNTQARIQGTTGAAMQFATGVGAWEWQMTDVSRFRLNQIAPVVNADVISVTQTGPNVGISTATPGCKFQVNGGAAIGYSASKTPPANGLAVSGAVVIGAGNIAPGTALLAVNGTVKAREVIATVAGWPDYVFKPGYALKSIDEVEQYIIKNNHLEGIPSAAEVQEQGVPLAEMQGKILKKLEETTLYLIEMKKENQALKTRLAALEKNVK